MKSIIKKVLLTLCTAFCALTVSQAQGIPSNVPTNGLMAYYGFDGNANDLSGNGNNGTLGCDAGASNPTLTADRFGAANKAYLFGGIDNRNWIKVNNSTSLAVNQAMSVSFWMKQSSARGQIISGGTGTATNSDALFTAIAKGGVNQPSGQNTPVSAGWRIETSWLANNQQKIAFANTNSEYLQSDMRVSANFNCYSVNQWLHIVYIIAPNSGKLYINGILVNEITNQTANFNVANTKPLYFGRLDGGDETWFPFSGVLDDIAIYNRAITNDEVAQLFNNFRDPIGENNRIYVNSVDIVNPCGTNSGSITINARPRTGVNYTYALGNPNSTQASNVLQAGPGTYHCYVVSDCSIWDTVVTLQCDCSSDPTLVNYDSICPGEQGVRGSIDAVYTANFDNGNQGWSGSSSRAYVNNNETNYRYVPYDVRCDDYWLYIYPGTCVSPPYDCSCQLIYLTSPQHRARSGKCWWINTYLGGERVGPSYSDNITSPAINIPCDPSKAQISFYYMAESLSFSSGGTGRNTLTLSVSSSSNSGYRQIWTSGGADVDSWRSASVALTSLPSSGNYYFRFSNSGNGYISAVEDVVVTCDNRRSIPVEVTSAAAGSTVRIDTPISAGDANSCPITQTTFWYIKPTTSSTEEVTTPPPSYTWHGQTYTANGTYSWNNNGRLKNRYNCDSTVYLNLTLDINNKYHDYQVVCDQLSWNGRTYTRSTEDSVRCTACNQWGGDSTTYLHLTVNYSTARDSIVVSCFPVEWQGTTYDDSFQNTAHLYTNVGHCDSLITLKFTRHYPDEVFLIDTSCDNETYTFNGNTIAVSGDYTAYLRNMYMCDSTVHLAITIFPSYRFNKNDSVDQEDLPYMGYLPISGEEYSYELRNELIHFEAVGHCDSNYYLTLVIRYKFYDCDAHLQFPNLVTPNGDNHNDRFYIIGLDNNCYPENELSIYNRWGGRVFHARNLQSGIDVWEPTNMPSGTYFYRFQGRNIMGSTERFGAVEIIKE